MKKWNIDIGDGERMERALLRQAQIYEYIYFLQVFRKCGYKVIRLNNSAELDGQFFEHHELEMKRCEGTFTLWYRRDYHRQKVVIPYTPISPGKKGQERSKYNIILQQVIKI